MRTGYELLAHLLDRHRVVRAECPWLTSDAALTHALVDGAFTEDQLGEMLAALATLANPRPGLAAMLEACRFRMAQRRAARELVWRAVNGGRASHAFTEGATVPLCGVQPRSSTGVDRVWKTAHGRTAWQRHAECSRRVRLLVAAGGLRPGVVF